MIALTNGPLMNQLEQLDLSLNQLTADAARAVAQCNRTKSLKSIDFGCNDIGDDGVIALMRSKNFPALEELHLSSTVMTDTGADAVLRAPWADQLTTLFMSYNTISQSKQAELTARFGSRLWITGVVRD
jgi:Ran GTPase-activating protein (RanGAP) involved in mRNA processing and transport